MKRSIAWMSKISDFSHINTNKKVPQMVDVSNKLVTKRTAVAKSSVILPKNIISSLEKCNDDIKGPKGLIFTASTIAGIIGAKKTSDLIPLCHSLPLETCDIDIKLIEKNQIDIICKVSTTYKTGVEMEALTGVSIAALCIYDMCKALSTDIIITNTKLISKTK